MTGLEQLIQHGYLNPKDPSKLIPKRFGSYGHLNLGATTLKTLNGFLSLDFSRAAGFKPERWSKPTNIGDCRPDALVIKASSVIAVIEHKSPGEITSKKGRETALEQAYVYMLATKAQLGVVTDGTLTYWLHDLDPKRPCQIKTIKGLSGNYSEDPLSDNFKYVLTHLDPSTDELTIAAAANPSFVARSVWQSVYIATRQSPEKCFQTFVELFMYKLLSDYELIPVNHRIKSLVIDSERFLSENGKTQIEFYVENIRGSIKSTIFPEQNTSRIIDGVNGGGRPYTSTASLITSLDTNGGRTSIIDGHAFENNTRAYNESFVTALRKLNQIETIVSLDKTFKSRVYEQFLRRDPNETKETGKYFTPRNIVKSIVQMADVSSLPPGSVICDPACGVGGFITEALLSFDDKGATNYREDANGEITVQRKFVGLERDENIVCLAKSNFLLHTIELFKNLTEQGRANYSNLLSDIFVQCHENPLLGTLAHPVRDSFNLIMANPPYVVSGTKEVSSTMAKSQSLSNFYDGGGSGLESRFVNWIVNSLVGGGKAFIILPKSMLARTEQGVKQLLLNRCTVDALVYLPSQCFYATPIETYIVAITRRYDDFTDAAESQEEPVLTYLVREIGETRDTRREPTDSDLPDMVRQYRSFMANRDSYEPSSATVKVIPGAMLSPSSRWDFDYLWTTSEREELGVDDPNTRTCVSIIEQLADVQKTIQHTESALGSISSNVTNWRTVGLSDEGLFRILRGKRVLQKNCKDHPGSVVIIASGRHKDSYFGMIDRDWLMRSFAPEGDAEDIIFDSSRRILTVGATGAVGRVHLRDEEEWFLHDDALAIEILSDEIDPLFCRFALQAAIDEARFDYSAKLYIQRLSAIKFRIPLDKNGVLDMKTQQEIATTLHIKESTELMMRALAESLRGVEIAVPVLT